MNLLLAWSIYIYLSVVGLVVIRFLPITEKKKKELAVISPIMGCIFIVNLVEIINTFAPVKYVSYVLIGLLVVGVLITIKKYRKTLLIGFGLNNLPYLLAQLIISIIYAIPLLSKFELYSIQHLNNDIMYYLANMDWLKNHSALEKVVYDDHHMYYWCAEYMLQRTRIGFDILGAHVISVTGLPSAFVFSDLGIAIVMMVIPATKYFVKNCNRMKKSSEAILITIICLCPLWSELIELQYLPHMLGSVLLVVFLAELTRFFSKNENKAELESNRFILCFIAAGLIAVYAEYTVYITIIVLIYAFMAIRYTKKTAIIAKELGKVFFGVIIFNPVGFYRCIKINLFVLTNSGADKGNIDPYGGVLMPIMNVLCKILGVPQTSDINGVFKSLYLIIVIAAFALVTFLFLYYVYSEKTPFSRLSICLVLAYALLELYFRATKYGYGEYKHILSSSYILYIIGASLIIKLYERKKSFLLKTAWVIMIFLLLGGGYRVVKQYYSLDYYLFDSSICKLDEVQKAVPDNETIGIAGNAASIHGMMYGLQKCDTTILANNVSYYPFSMEPSTRYRLYEEDIDEMQGAKVLWKNGRFTLVENTSLQSTFYSGFHNYDWEKNMIWTCEDGAIICVTNYSNVEKNIALCFGTDSVNAQDRTFNIMLEGKTIASDSVGNLVVTDDFYLKPNATAKIYVYDNKPLDDLNGFQVGIALQNYYVIDYEIGNEEESIY